MINVELNRACFHSLSSSRWSANVCVWDYNQQIKPINKDSVITFYNYPNEAAVTNSIIELKIRANKITARERFIR